MYSMHLLNFSPGVIKKVDGCWKGMLTRLNPFLMFASLSFERWIIWMSKKYWAHIIFYEDKVCVVLFVFTFVTMPFQVSKQSTDIFLFQKGCNVCLSEKKKTRSLSSRYRNGAHEKSTKKQLVNKTWFFFNSTWKKWN